MSQPQGGCWLWAGLSALVPGPPLAAELHGGTGGLLLISQLPVVWKLSRHTPSSVSVRRAAIKTRVVSLLPVGEYWPNVGTNKPHVGKLSLGRG